MKKICFVSTIPASLRTFMIPLANALFETGEFEVYFMASSDADIEKEYPSFVHFLPVRMKRGISFDGLKVVSQMKKIFKKEKFDIVQYFTPNASFYASIAAKRAKVPVRIYTQWGLVYISFSGFKRKIFKFLEKSVCKNSTWIEVENNANLEFAHKEKLYSQDKGIVVWNGSASGVSLTKYDYLNKLIWKDEIRQKLNISPNNFTFGFCGRQNKDKGLNELLNAFKLFSEKYDDVDLIIVGASSDSATLDKNLLDWAHSCDKIHFTGRVSNTEAYYSAMDWYVMPSYREGFGMTIIEAGAMGVPAIVTEITGHQDTIIPNKTGFFVDVKSSSSIFEKMEYVYKNRDIMQQFSEEARKYVVDSFEQKKLINQVVNIRKNLVNGG